MYALHCPASLYSPQLLLATNSRLRSASQTQWSSCWVLIRICPTRLLGGLVFNVCTVSICTVFIITCTECKFQFKVSYRFIAVSFSMTHSVVCHLTDLLLPSSHLFNHQPRVIRSQEKKHSLDVTGVDNSGRRSYSHVYNIFEHLLLSLHFVLNRNTYITDRTELVLKHKIAKHL